MILTSLFVTIEGFRIKVVQSLEDVGLTPDPEAIDAAANITQSAGINNTDNYIDPHDPSFRAGVLDVLYLNNFYVGRWTFVIKRHSFLSTFNQIGSKMGIDWML